MSEKEHKPAAREPEAGMNGLEIIGDVEPPSCTTSFGDTARKKEDRAPGAGICSLEVVDAEEPPLAAQYDDSADIKTDPPSLEVIHTGNAPQPIQELYDNGPYASSRPQSRIAASSSRPLRSQNNEQRESNNTIPELPSGSTNQIYVDNAVLANDEEIIELVDAEIIHESRGRLENKYVFTLISVALIVCTAVIGGVVLIQDKNAAKATSVTYITKTSRPTSTLTSTFTPTLGPTRPREEVEPIKEDIEANVLLRGARFSELPDTDSRKLALEWLLHDNPMQPDASDSNLRQRYILALLAFEFGGLLISLEDVDWLSDGDECEWNGVSCDDGGKVSELDLHSPQPTERNLPPEISKLEELTWLWLYTNQLTSTVPSELGNLKALNKLYLSDNQLTGTIPSELGNLEQLALLYLYDNQLTGTIPSELGTLEELAVLSLWSNQLKGTIPSELGNLRKLTHLYLWSNQLTCTIPSELGNLGELFALTLSNNQLTGTVPSELGNLKALNKLYLYDNQLTGTIPSELSSIFNLDTSGNELS